MATIKAKDFKGRDMKPLIVLREGEIIDYQTIIEETIGDWLSGLSCYDANMNRKEEINGIEVERDRAYFVPDSDYELIIRKLK